MFLTNKIKQFIQNTVALRVSEADSRILKKLQESLEDHIFNAFKELLDNDKDHVITRGRHRYDRYWKQTTRKKIVDAITENIKTEVMQFKLGIREEISNSIEEQVYSEKFLDCIIDRIKRKQLK